MPRDEAKPSPLPGTLVVEGLPLPFAAGRGSGMPFALSRLTHKCEEEPFAT